MNKQKTYNIPVLSFFTGGGFLDMGFEMAGFKIVWSNEYDEVFSQLHSAGITSWRKSRGNGKRAEIINNKSITEISFKEILKEAFPEGKPNIFGIIGGPPCQDFSMNGNLKGFQGNRGKLTETFLNKILEIKPTFFVMENVPGLIRAKSSKKYMEILLSTVTDKYFIDSHILNALSFGVPQNRQRVFFVGLRKDRRIKQINNLTSNSNWFKNNVNGKIIYHNPLKGYDWPKTDTFGNKPIKPTGIPAELYVDQYLINSKDTVANSHECFKLKVDGSKLNSITEGETKRQSFKRLHRYRYSPTSCYGNNEVHLHPYKNRRLTVREVLRIQGVPDEYELPEFKHLSKKFKMIGNGVPVPLAYAVAETMMDILVKNLT